MGQQHSAGASHRRRDDKGHDFILSCVHAHCFGGKFVFTNRDQRASESRVDDVVDDYYRQNRDQEYPEEALDNRYAGIATCAADRFNVIEKHDDDLTKPECYDCQVVAAETQRRNADDETRNSRRDSADESGEE